MSVRACRVRSSETSTKSVTERTRTLTQLHASISGGDSSTQLRSELPKRRGKKFYMKQARSWVGSLEVHSLILVALQDVVDRCSMR